jgi:hypothetical protein
LEEYLVTAVPLQVAIEKLRGFVADHEARIEASDDRRVCIALDGPGAIGVMRRSADRRVSLLAEVTLAEEQVRGTNSTGQNGGGTVTRTKIHVVVRPRRDRDRRRSTAVGKARRLLASLRSYLMAIDDSRTD